MALRKEKLIQFKKQLIDRRETLAREVQAATAEMIDDETTYADAVDQASAETDKSITVQMKNRDRTILAQINEALRRIEDGSFGVCDSCGEEIAEARMRVNPATVMCIDCQTEIEAEQNRLAKHPV
jgi:DnaK suppressor protein